MQTVDFRRIEFKPNDVVLDLGCGEGRHVISVFLEAAQVHSFGVDLCLEDLETTQNKLEEFSHVDAKGQTFTLSQANAMSLPFADDTFDTIICSEVLEHIPDYQAVIVEIDRILKPGGSFIASVPRYWPERVCWAFSDEYHANEGGHLRIFKASSLRAQIEGVGFAFLERHWAHALHSPYWWLQCLFWDNKENSKLVQLYRRFLEWDIMDQPKITGIMERLLNPLMGKSVVMYFKKGAAQ